MGNFEKLSVLVIVVIILMILVVALYTWTDNPDGSSGADKSVAAVDETKGMQAVMPPSVRPKSDGKSERGNGLNPLDRVTPPAPNPLSIVPFPPPVDVPPAPAPAPEPPKPLEAKKHVVQAGETIGKIAKTYYPGRVAKGTDAILKANPTVEPTRMRQGITLTIPDLGVETSSTNGAKPATLGVVSDKPMEASGGVTKGSTYVVRKGDSLPSLSRKAYGDNTRWQDIWLANFNAIEDPDHLLPGTRLKIPH